MNIIEKLRITKAPWNVPEINSDCVWSDSANKVVCYDIQNHELDAKLIASAPDMLKFLINMAFCLDRIGKGLEDQSELKLLVEKATGKTWKEIKDLL